MHFDALTLACVATELNVVLRSGRVQQVVMVDDARIGLEIYADRVRHYLLLAADRGASYAYLSADKLRRGVDAQPPLLLLLRKYVRGAQLTDVIQPDPTERALHLHFAHSEVGRTTLIFEPMGRMANLLLVTEAGRILDCLYRVRPGENRRPLMPGQPYAPPLPMAKLPPLDDGRADYYADLAAVTQTDGKLWRALVDGVAGVSPTQARELAWRATGSADAAAAEAEVLAIAQALQALWEPVTGGSWTPGLIMEDENPAGFTPYQAHFRGAFVAQPSMSAALERYYGAKQNAANIATNQMDAAQGVATPVDGYAAQRAVVRNQLAQARKRLRGQLKALAADEPAPGEPEALRHDAEWLLALASQIKPGQKTLDIELEERTHVIALDPQKKPIEQAQQMFKRAAKLERAAVFIPKRKRQLKRDLTFLAQLEVDLADAENQPEIAAVQRELDKLGLKRGKLRKTKDRGGGAPTGPRRFESATGFEILVGRNARQNDAVSFRLSQAEDLWLHVRGAPGSHVVIRRRGAEPDAATIGAAAQLAAYYSGLRGERAAQVILTRCRFVSRVAGGRPGQVTVRNDSTVTVPAELPVTATEVS